jgi:hypothetical protein
MSANLFLMSMACLLLAAQRANIDALKKHLKRFTALELPFRRKSLTKSNRPWMIDPSGFLMATS